MANQELAVSTVKKVSDLLTENSQQLSKLLPHVITPQRFMSVVINVIQNDPKLQECTATSLVRCIFQSAQLGLVPGLRRQSYLVPFKNNKKGGIVEAQLLIGYQGLLDMARRSGEIVKVDAKEVYEGDVFRYTDGYDDTLVHEPISTIRNEPDPLKRWPSVTACYAFAKLKNGEHQKVVMTKQQIEGHRNQWSKAKDSGPWVTSPIEMALKTVLRELTNLLPSADESASLSHAYALDTQVELGQAQTIELTEFHLDDEQPLLTSKEPAKEDEVRVPVLPNFGTKANLSLTDANVSIGDLHWYLKVKQEGLNKPGRERFAKEDVSMISAIQEELLSRESVEKAKSEATHQPTSADQPAATPEAATGPMPFAEWQAFIDKVSLGDSAPLFGKVKKEFKAKSAGEVPTDKQRAFVARFYALQATPAST